MKNHVLKSIAKLFFGAFLLMSSFAFSQTQTEKYFVSGNCGMCKNRIETTAKKSGADAANWDSETKILEVEYNSAKTSKEEILKKIAEAGHDNELFRASDEVYENLPGCCHYDRKISEKSINKND
ncbi:MAG: cation transporter [Flavobacteriaceae bacterium]|jgi:copper chaperone CopZ|nr:cation transporter [Flavobacteriaceae bacterium]